MLLNHKRYRPTDEESENGNDLFNGQSSSTEDSKNEYCRFYQNVELNKTFFEGICIMQLKSNELAMPITINKIEKESRTKIPIFIEFKFSREDKNNFIFSFQINDKENKQDTLYDKENLNNKICHYKLELFIYLKNRVKGNKQYFYLNECETKTLKFPIPLEIFNAIEKKLKYEDEGKDLIIEQNNDNIDSNEEKKNQSLENQPMKYSDYTYQHEIDTSKKVNVNPSSESQTSYTFIIEMKIFKSEFVNKSIMESTTPKTNSIQNGIASTINGSNEFKKDIEVINTNENKIQGEISTDSKNTHSHLLCGLYNSGSTCYMNSLIQFLYMLKYFKEAIFNVEIKRKNYKNSKIFNFQKLFYDLMTSDHPISTNALTNCFGWDESQVYIQRDVQEFFIVLSAAIEEEMKDTDKKDTFKYLFEGQSLTKIECINVKFTSKKLQNFSDIQLPIKGCKNIIESLDTIVKDEILQGDNQYDTENKDFGKQDAKRSLKFTKLPRVLVIQLNRYDYNSQNEVMEKINERFEYTNELDMRKYMSTEDENSNIGCTEYECFGVVVHQGDTDMGHYFSYIKYINSDKDAKKYEWYRFNDNRFEESEEYEVFNNNYGGEKIFYNLNNSFNNDVFNLVPNKRVNNVNAYLLMYIRKDCIHEMAGDYPLEKIPQYIKDQFLEEKRLKEFKDKEEYKKKYFINVHIITEEILNEYGDIGIIENYNYMKDDETYNKYYITFQCFKEVSIKEFLDTLSEVTGISTSKMFLFQYKMEQYTTYLQKNCYDSIYIKRKNYDEKINHNFFSNCENPSHVYFYLHISKNIEIIPYFELLSKKDDLEYNEDKNIKMSQIKDKNIKKDMMDSDSSGDESYIDIDKIEAEDIKYEIKISNQDNFDVKNNIICQYKEINNKLFYNKKKNIWELKDNRELEGKKVIIKKNDDDEDDIEMKEPDDTKIYDDDEFILFIVKHPIINYVSSTCEMKVKYKIYDSFVIMHEYCANIQNQEALDKEEIINRINCNWIYKDSTDTNKLIMQQMKDQDTNINYLIEYTCLNKYFFSNIGDFSYNNDSFKYLTIYKRKNDCTQFNNNILILIINFEFNKEIPLTDEIGLKDYRSFLDKFLYNKIFENIPVDLICEQNNKKAIKINEEHININLNDSIDKIRRIILDNLHEEDLYKFITNGNEVYKNMEVRLFCHKKNLNSESNDIDISLLDILKNDEYLSIIQLFCLLQINEENGYIINNYLKIDKDNSYISFYIDLDQFSKILNGKYYKNLSSRELILSDYYSNPKILLIISDNFSIYLGQNYRLFENNIEEFITNKKNKQLYDSLVPKEKAEEKENIKYILISYQRDLSYTNDYYETPNKCERECYNGSYICRIQPYKVIENSKKYFIRFFEYKKNPICLPTAFDIKGDKVTLKKFKNKIIDYLKHNDLLSKKIKNFDNIESKIRFTMFELRGPGYHYLMPSYDNMTIEELKMKFQNNLFNFNVDILSDAFEKSNEQSVNNSQSKSDENINLNLNH